MCFTFVRGRNPPLLKEFGVQRELYIKTVLQEKVKYNHSTILNMLPILNKYG